MGRRGRCSCAALGGCAPAGAGVPGAGWGPRRAGRAAVPGAVRMGAAGRVSGQGPARALRPFPLRVIYKGVG